MELPVKIPIRENKLQEGGEGVIITYDWLESELKKMCSMGLDEEISQVIIEEEGIMLCFKKKEDINDQ